MENSGFNLMAGVIAAAILVMGVGMYIYNSASSTISDSVNAMTTQEKDAFNNQFVAYEGAQTGSKVKALCGVLIANSNTYQDEVDKIPKITIGDKINEAGDEVSDAVVESTEDVNEYVEIINKIRQELENKHTYFLTMHFNTEGIIDEIIIYYEG